LRQGCQTPFLLHSWQKKGSKRYVQVKNLTKVDSVNGAERARQLRQVCGIGAASVTAELVRWTEVLGIADRCLR
jgi:hypothetical protein